MPGLTPAGISKNHKGKSVEMNSNGGRSKFIWWALNETLIKRKKKSKKEKNISCTRQAKNHIKDHDGMAEARSAMIQILISGTG